MDRTDGQNYIDIGGGRRGFRDQNVDAGVPGTRVTAAFLNSLQEEILTVIENAGITPAAADWSQLDAAIRKVAAKTVNDYIIPLAQLNALPWLPVISLTQKKPPAKPALGDLYVVPDGGTGEWSDKGGQIAEWNGQKWLFSNSRDGHGIGLPDGQILQKVGGVYVPQVAIDSQSGKWLYAEASGTANALTATLTPTPLFYSSGMAVRLKLKSANTGTATLNVNGLGAKPIIYHETGEPLVGGDFQAGDVVSLVFDGASWRLQATLAYMDKRYSRLTAPPTDTYYVNSLTGDDGNSGIAPDKAFKTIQGAIDAIRTKYISFGAITINVAAGNYAGFSVGNTYISQWNIIGAGVDKTKVYADNINTTTGRGVAVSGGNVVVSNMYFSAYYEGATVGAGGGFLEILTCKFNLSSGAAIGIGNVAGQISVYGNIDFSGSGRACVMSGGLIRLGFKDDISQRAVALGWASGMKVTEGNFVATDGGSLQVFSSVFYQGGAPSGRKFLATMNGIISVGGAGVNFFAGTDAGLTLLGGQYF